MPRAAPSSSQILFGLALLLSSVTSYSDATHIASLLGPRPEIRDYARQDDFVTDLLAWQQKKRDLEEKLARGELPLPQPAKQQDWHHITGPEDLDTALEKAEGYVQPHYKEQQRYNRSTHVSFPLPPLPQQKLAEEVLPSAPVIIPQNKEADPATLLEENQRLQQELSTRQPGTPDVEYYRESRSSYSVMR